MRNFKLNITEQDNIRWDYNGLDVIYTLEVAEVLENQINKSSDKLKSFYNFQIKEIAPALIDIMNHGIKIDLEKKQHLHEQLTILLKEVEEKLNYLIGEPFNPKSQPQIKAVFKELCGITPIKDKKTKSESFSSISMFEYRELYPEYRALIDLILEYRSIGVFLRTFVSAEVDEDGRMRTSYGVAGTKTYRLSSRKNAFGTGANLANIPSKGKIDLKYSLASIEDEDDEEDFISGDYEGITKLPNCKEFFIPDEGCNFFNADFSGADAMIVAADSDCKWLLDFFKNSKLKLYQYIASHYYQREIKTTDKEYKIFKQFIHGCVTGDHEVLTTQGWKRIDSFDYTKEELAVWDRNSQKIWFEQPKDFTTDFITEKEPLVKIESKNYSHICTVDHKLPIVHRPLKDKFDLVPINHVYGQCELKIPLVGNYLGGTIHKPKAFMQLLAAFQADGRIQSFSKERGLLVGFRFKKTRKIDRLKSILNDLNITFYETVYSELTGEVTYISFNSDLEEYHKKINWYMLDFSKENLETWVKELPYWDGHVRINQVRTEISTSDKLAAEIIQTLIHLTGNSSTIGFTEYENVNHSTSYRVSIRKQKNAKIHREQVELIDHKGTMVYCPTTTTGCFLVRVKHKIMITGNSHYGMQEKKAALNAGISEKDAKKIINWYFSLAREIPLWHKRIESSIKTKGFIENIFGARGWFLNKESPTILNQAYAWIPQCVPLDHEVLTKDGWKTIKSVAATEEIAVWDENRNITFEVPKQWNFTETDSLIHLETLDYYCTGNHTLPYYNFGDIKLRTCTAETKPKSAQIPKNGIYSQGSISLSKEQIGLLVAFQADGFYNSIRDCLQFEFRKIRKIERLENILNSLGIVYTKSSRKTRSNCTLFYIPKISRYLDPTRKFFGNWLLDLTQDSLLYFLEELQYWDGSLSKENQIWYSSSIKLNTDWVITVASLCGKKAYYISPDVRAINTNHRVLINLSNRGKNAITTSKHISKQCKVACPTTSTGFFLIKYNDKISVTGNSSIAILVNKGLCNIHYKEKKEDISVLMQVHDALAGQYRKSLGDKEAEKRICKHMSVELPYKDKLIIPVDFSFSEKSYGDCK